MNDTALLLTWCFTSNLRSRGSKYTVVPHPGKAAVLKTEMWGELVRMYKTTSDISSLYLDSEAILVVARPNGFSTTPDSLDYAKKKELRQRLRRNDLCEQRKSTGIQNQDEGHGDCKGQCWFWQEAKGAEILQGPPLCDGANF
ncbi:hypothetical protein ACRRTK_024963 [Alexandromys fortis]